MKKLKAEAIMAKNKLKRASMRVKTAITTCMLANGKEMKRIAEQCLKEMNKKDATQISDDEISGIRVYKK